MKQLQIILLAVAVTATPALAVDWNNPGSVARGVIEVNPSLAALSARILEAQARISPAGSLPNPTLMGGVENEPVNLSYDFMTMYSVGVSQTLVRKPRRDGLRHQAELDVERFRHEYEALKAEVEREARTTYIEAAAAQNEIAATEEISRLLKAVTDSTRSRYESGAVPQSDLIRAMLEQSIIEHQLITLRRRRNVAIARLLPLLQLPPDTEVPPFALKHEMEHGHGHDHGFDAVLPDMTAAIAGLHTEVDRADVEIRLAKLAAKPDISIEASYGHRPREVDMVTLLARVELPVRRSTLIEPRIREAMARREAALRQMDAGRQQLRQDLGAALVLRNEAIEQINLHVDRLVPAAKLAFESTLTSYKNSKTTFDAVLGSLRTYLALNVDYYDFVRQQLEAEADIEAIQHGAHSGMGSGGAPGTAAPSSSAAAAATMQ